MKKQMIKKIEREKQDDDRIKWNICNEKIHSRKIWMRAVLKEDEILAISKFIREIVHEKQFLGFRICGEVNQFNLKSKKNDFCNIGNAKISSRKNFQENFSEYSINFNFKISEKVRQI